MPVSPTYRNFILEQLNHIAPVTARSMFGGVGLYADDLFFALIDNDRLYFKADDTNRPDFEAAGMGQFMPFGDAGMAMQYYEVPGEVLDDEDELRGWLHKAVDVALRNKKPKKAKSAKKPKMAE